MAGIIPALRGKMQVNRWNRTQTMTKEFEMKKLVTVSAIVFFMIFTAGLATAKTPTPFFPFAGAGDFESSTTAGVLTSPITGSITVNEVNGSLGFLWFGTLTWGSTTANFSAVSDAPYVSGTPKSTVVFTFTGLTTTNSNPVHGAFTFGKAKDPSDNDRPVEAAFVTLFIPSTGDSFAGTLFTD